MALKIIQNIRLYIHQETGAERWQRMWICALVGILITTICVWMMSTINLITLPQQHLGLDWHRLWFYWSRFSLVAGIEGLFVGWFTENTEGIAYGWIPVELLIIIGYSVNLFYVTHDPLFASLTIVVLMEMTGIFILIALILRSIGNKFFRNAYSENKTGWNKSTRLFVLGTVLFCLVIGGLARFDLSVVRALSAFNETMEKVIADPGLEPKLPFGTIPELRSHLGQPYKLYPRPDTAVVGNYLFSVVFSDGFSFTCTVSVADYHEFFFFNTCNNGTDFSFP